MKDLADDLQHEMTVEDKRSARRNGMMPWVIALFVVVVIAFAWFANPSFHDHATEVWTVLSGGDQEEIRTYLDQFGALAPIVSILLMVMKAVFAPIPASVVQLSNGVIFGVIPGTVLNVIGQMLGASLAFGITRVLGQSAAERLAGRIDEHGVVERWLDHWGAKALLLVRILPGMPSDFVSYLMGLTRMSFRTFFMVSLLGYIPQSLAYAWLGDAATDYFWWIILAGFVISAAIGGVFWMIKRTRPRPLATPEPQGDSC